MSNLPHFKRDVFDQLLQLLEADAVPRQTFTVPQPHGDPGILDEIGVGRPHARYKRTRSDANVGSPQLYSVPILGYDLRWR